MPTEAKEVEVVIIGDHPHEGERGRIVFIDGKTTVKRVFDDDMYLVQHLTGNASESCYAKRENLRMVKS